MPIYEYTCGACNAEFERIEPVTERTWKEDMKHPVTCPECKLKVAFKSASIFKIDAWILDTRGKSGYDDDDLTLGKIIDNDGIPYEFKDGIREQVESVEANKAYMKGLRERAKKYDFDPFSTDDDAS